MLFNSFDFLIFLPIVFALYWKIFSKNVRLRNLFLLGASYLFYGWWDWRFLSLIIFSSAVDYLAGLKIHEQDQHLGKRRRYLWVSVFTNIGFLGFFKYFNFFSDSFAEILTSFGIQVNTWSLQIILPVGISFYTFQTLSYTIDIYRGNVKPTRDPIAFFAFVSFFPQLVAGPIERAKNLLPQFKTVKKFSYYDASIGLRLILWGFFKKVVIADNSAIYVNQIFANYASSSGIELVLGTVLFSFQIYCDFSGYSDIAIGTAKLFGFDLMTNFKTPYFSRDIAEFWRRWHISLSTWFRDYVYIPVGGSRVGQAKLVRNIFLIFIVSGFWHGANWTFIIWGALNAIYYLPLLFGDKNRQNLDVVANDGLFPGFGELVKMGGTYLLTCFAWIFFRSESVSDAFLYIKHIFLNDYDGFNFIKLDEYFIIMILVWIVFDWLGRKKGVEIFITELESKYLRYSLYYMLIVFILIFGAFHETEFIYFQF